MASQWVMASLQIIMTPPLRVFPIEQHKYPLFCLGIVQRGKARLIMVVLIDDLFQPKTYCLVYMGADTRPEDTDMIVAKRIDGRFILARVVKGMDKIIIIPKA